MLHERKKVLGGRHVSGRGNTDLENQLHLDAGTRAHDNVYDLTEGLRYRDDEYGIAPGFRAPAHKKGARVCRDEVKVRGRAAGPGLHRGPFHPVPNSKVRYLTYAVAVRRRNTTVVPAVRTNKPMTNRPHSETVGMVGSPFRLHVATGPAPPQKSLHHC